MSVPNVFGSLAGDELSSLLYQACPDAVVVIDGTGTILFANPAVETVFGYKPDEVVGERLSILQPESLRDAHRRGLARYLATGESKLDWRATQTFGLHKDGHEFPVEIAFTGLAPRRFGGFIRDVSKRVEAERALEASEARYGDLPDHAADVIYQHDMDGTFVYLNAAGLRTFGYTAEEAAILNIKDIVEPDYLAAATREILAQLAQGEQVAPYEILTRTKSGDQLWFEVSVRGASGEDGELIGYRGIARNIDERKRAEQALSATEERYRELMDNANDIIYTHDLQGAFTYVNAAGARTFGYAAAEVLELNMRQIVDPEHLEHAVQSIAQKLKDGAPTPPYSLLTRTREGRPIWLEVSTRIVRGADGAPVAVQGIARDVTARRQAEEQLARAREFRDRVLESSSNAIGAFDLEGRLTLVNQRLCHMTGYDEQELLGERLWTLIVPGSSPEIGPSLQRVMAGESLDDLEFDAVRKDGTPFSARAALRPLVDGDRIIGVIGTAEDITERKRSGDVLAAQRQLLEMIAVGAPLGDVLAQIATTVERQTPGRCSILLLHEDGRRLRPGAAPSLPAELVAATDGLEIGPAVGTCGTAAYRGEPVFSEDIASDPLWEGAHELMAGLGIVASWSTPIRSGSGAVLGTFAMYYHERHTPTPQEEQIVGVLTHVAGIAIERDHALAQATKQTTLLAEKSALLEAALTAERERARRDPLTGSLNHAVIAEEVRRLIDDASVKSFALAMLDVDGLKAVNDTYGHQMGDAVLLAVANSLCAEGAIVGRYGGDEFVAILPEADREAAAAYRQRVIDALAAVELHDAETGSRIQIDASVGLAIYPEEGDAVEDLIKLSDSAMYAFRRQRADLSAPAAFARIHGGDRAAEIVGEIVPFLTSPGDLQEKLNLVAARVSAGAGYAGVNFALYGGALPSARSASFSPESSEAAREYDAESMPPEEPGPMRRLLEATKRPVIIDDVSTSEFTTPEQREILKSVGIRSGLVVPMIWRGTNVGAISVGSKREAAFGPRDAQFLVAIATQVTAIVRTAALVDDLQMASDRLLQAQTETVLMLAAAAEAHDDTTGRHLQRVRRVAQALAKELGHDDDKAKEIGLAAVLHDIGKIRVPDYVLASSASLSDAEWSLMKDHTIWGSEFLGSRGGFGLAMQVARSHHERWDGSGYPDGIAGPLIPEAAAITSVADSLDAMINDRPYRPGRPLDDAIQEVIAWSGRQFSPRVVEALVALYERGELSYLIDEAPPQQIAA